MTLTDVMMNYGGWLENRHEKAQAQLEDVGEGRNGAVDEGHTAIFECKSEGSNEMMVRGKLCLRHRMWANLSVRGQTLEEKEGEGKLSW